MVREANSKTMIHRMILFVALAIVPADGCQWIDNTPAADESKVDERPLSTAASGPELTSVSTAEGASVAPTTLVVAEDVATSPADVQEIVLKGFVNVDEIRASLEIDGRVTAIPAGGWVGDIRLESISLHGVTLKKGRAQWQLVLATDEVE